MRCLVIGVGNPLRRDDGLGPWLAERIAQWRLPGVDTRAVHQLTPELAADMARHDRILFVDATHGPVESRSGPLRLDDEDDSLTRRWGHVFGPRELMSLSAGLGGACKAWVAPVLGYEFDFGEGLSDAAVESGEKALHDIAHWLKQDFPGSPESGGGAARLARRVRVTGHVQGVGFRPFVKRLADALGLSGHVGNDAFGVFITVDGPSLGVKQFLTRLRSDAPSAARIEAILDEAVHGEAVHGEAVHGDGSGDARADFAIVASPQRGDATSSPCQARVPRDRAVCGDCLAEVHAPMNRRASYVFTTCTTCGPRYTVLDSLPYERSATSMKAFPLCRECAREFGGVHDRRFHAEVMSCPRCGPRLTQVDLAVAAEALRRGAIVALKGLGGYQLLVRADDEAAIARLRVRKQRPSKPLAVMVRSRVDADHLAVLGNLEHELLASPENPIVLAPLRSASKGEGAPRPSCRSERALASNIAPHLDHVGLFLPTTPMHDLLLEQLPFPIVATSGNRGEEPILADDAAETDLAQFADVVVTHDRPIARSIDDSVVRVIDGKPSVLRLARGYAPLPLTALERWATRHRVSVGGVLALGGQQKNAVALWNGVQAVLGPHVGDLDGSRSRSAWRRHLEEFTRLYGVALTMLVVDRHPDYASRRWAEASGLPMIEAAHHHAHAVAAMVEHDLLDQSVLAFTWDGTGLGPDGTLWGGEALHATMHAAERIATIRPIRLPGGEAAIHQPWRIGAALLKEVALDAPRWVDVPRPLFDGVTQLLDRNVLCPAATSLGRLFDGIASLLLGVQGVSYEGEAAAWLEAIADPAVVDAYPVVVQTRDRLRIWDWRPVVHAVLADQRRGVPVSSIASRFNETIARWAEIVARESTEPKVVLTGGCFQNALLTTRVRRRLESIGKRVSTPGLIPVNDGGLAAGQLAIGLGSRT